MDGTMIGVLLGLAGIAAGFVVSYFIFNGKAKGKEEDLEKKKKQLEEEIQQKLKDADEKSEMMKKNRMLEAKEKFLQLKAEHEK